MHHVVNSSSFVCTLRALDAMLVHINKLQANSTTQAEAHQPGLGAGDET